LLFFFRDAVFNGKVFTSGDTVASHSFETFVNDARDQGIFPLWNPYIFCGMPAYASLSISAERMFDLSDFLWQKSRLVTKFFFLNAEMGATLFYYLLFSIGVYFFASSKLKHWLASLMVALATTFSMFIIIWVMVGHITKIGVIAWVPYIFLIIEQLRVKFDLKLSLALAVVLHLAFGPSHMQMLFYVYFALGIYFLFFLIRSLIVKESVANLLIAGVVLTAATGLAFGMNADQYLSTLEYNQYSIRGSSPMEQPGAPQKPDAEKPTGGGLDYTYATQWSFAPSEMVTFFIPSAYGFGNVQYEGMLTREPTKINMYFGPQYFTDGPQYMGIAIIILAFCGIVLKRKDPFVQYLVVLVVVSLLISFGKEFSLLYNPMFHYFPMFNKFRIPSMILVLVQLATPILAGYGLVALIAERSLTPAASKKWMIRVAVLGVLAVLSVVAKDLFISIYAMFFPKAEAAAVLGRMVNNQAAAVDELYRFVTDMVAVDITIGFAILTVLFGAIMLYRQRKISLTLLSVVVLVVVTGDLWRVAMKPMEMHDRSVVNAEFATAPDYVKYLQADTTLYRTLEFVGGQPPYSNSLAFWRIQSAYGYQGAKMRAWQDMVDIGGIGNPLVWGLMNVKYILSDRADSNQVMLPVFNGQERKVMYNRMELPRAFFVNRYEVAPAKDILKKIAAMSFNPRDVMYLSDDPHVAVAPAGPGASAKYVKYGIQDLEIQATATGTNLLYVSEAYYPNGWKAFIDGAETPIYRADYLFRAVVVPQGTHTITMKFEPRGFFLGKTISLVINLFVLGALGILSIKKYVKKKS
jgi:hypothetical protein